MQMNRNHYLALPFLLGTFLIPLFWITDLFLYPWVRYQLLGIRLVTAACLLAGYVRW